MGVIQKKFQKERKITSYNDMLVFYAWEITHGLRKRATRSLEGRKEIGMHEKESRMEVERVT